MMKQLFLISLVSLLALVPSTGAIADNIIPTTKPIITKHVFGVHGLSCPFCAIGIKKTFEKVHGVQTVNVSLKNSTVTVYTNKGVCFSEKELKSLFNKTAFSYRGTRVKPKSCEQS